MTPPLGGGNRGHAERIQVDHHAAGCRSVINFVGAGFLPWRCELGRKAVADVVTLCEIALAVENLDTCPNMWRVIRSIYG